MRFDRLNGQDYVEKYSTGIKRVYYMGRSGNDWLGYSNRSYY